MAGGRAEIQPVQIQLVPRQCGEPELPGLVPGSCGSRRRRSKWPIRRLPPIQAFQSIVDSTVSTAAVVRDLFDQLRGKDDELVVFDINRRAGLEPYIRPADAALALILAAGGPRLYRRTLITNISADVSEVRARSVAPGATTVEDVPLGLSWPAQVFSLSHVALPFAI